MFQLEPEFAQAFIFETLYIQNPEVQTAGTILSDGGVHRRKRQFIWS
jgi:hypothetical protein